MSQSKVLADRIYSGEGIAADALRIVAANILLVLCAHIVIPLPWTPVPITGQTFGVLLVAVLLGARRGAITLILYLLEGAAGLPVFQPLGLPGLARFAGPTAGYLLSYPVAAFVTGWLVERGAKIREFARRRLVACRFAADWRADFRRSDYFCVRLRVAGVVSGNGLERGAAVRARCHSFLAKS